MVTNCMDIFMNMSEGFALHEIICDDEGKAKDYRFITVNSVFEEITGFKAKDIIGKTIKTIAPDIEQYWIDTYGEVALAGKTEKLENYFAHLDKHFKVDVFSPMKGQFATLFMDITENKKNEILLEKYKILSENVADIILFINKEGNIIEVNKAGEKNYGYSRKELLKMGLGDIRLENNQELIRKQIADAIQKDILFETRHIRKDGTVFPVQVSAKLTKINGEEIIISIVRDITQQKKDAEYITRLANYDTLTNLPNRKMIMEKLEENIQLCRENKEKFSLMFLDIDKFKYVNDNYGHPTGDELLKQVASRLSALIDKGDILARLGGDEFVLLQINIKDKNQAKNMGEKIVSSISVPFNLKGIEIKVSTSVGISLYPFHGEDIETLMKNSDISMYRVKDRGGNGLEFYN